MKTALAIVLITCSIANATPTVKRLMTDEEYLASMITKAESLQIQPMSDANRSSLYFLDKKMLEICPKDASNLSCIQYFKANPLRFGFIDSRYFVTDHWLASQKEPDPRAHGDFDLDRIRVMAGGLGDSHSVSVETLESTLARLKEWLQKYPEHLRLAEAHSLQSSLKRQIESKRSNRETKIIDPP